MDQAGFASRLQLFPEIANVDLDDIRFTVEDVPPDPLKDHTAIKDLVRVLQEQTQEFVLGRRKRDPAVTAPGLARSGVQTQVREAQLAPAMDGPAAEFDMDPGEQFLERKGFHDIVIGANLQPGHAVRDGVTGRKDDDGQGLIGSAEAAADFESVDLREEQIEDNQIWPDLARLAQRLFAVGRRTDVVPFQREFAPEQGADLFVIINYKNVRSHGSPVLINA